MREPGAAAGSFARVAAGVAVGAALIAVWPAFSEWWVGFLRFVGYGAAGDGPVVVPATASPAIPVAVGIVCALALPLRRRSSLAFGLALSTLACELLVVAAGALAHLPAGAVNVLVGIPVGVPFVWLLIAVTLARRVVPEVPQGR